MNKEKDFLHYFLKKNIIELNDKNLNNEIKKDQDDEPANILLTDIKKSSLANHEQKRNLKKKFFWIVMSMYVVVVLGGIAAFILIPIYCSNLTVGITGLAASLASVISSILKIPSIIATYLFPKGEDDLLIKLSDKAFKHVEIMNGSNENGKKKKKYKADRGEDSRKKD